MSLASSPETILRPHVAIVGFAGAGKSTVGDALADRLGCPHYDSDVVIEQRWGRSSSELAERLGVEALHRIEAELLIGFLRQDEPSVISAAASVVDRHEARHALAERAFTCWVAAPLDALIARTRVVAHRRSMSLDEITELWFRRRPWFRAVADVQLDGTRDLDDQLARLLSASGGTVAR